MPHINILNLTPGVQLTPVASCYVCNVIFKGGYQCCISPRSACHPAGLKVIESRSDDKKNKKTMKAIADTRLNAEV